MQYENDLLVADNPLFFLGSESESSYPCDDALGSPGLSAVEARHCREESRGMREISYPESRFFRWLQWLATISWTVDSISRTAIGIVC